MGQICSFINFSVFGASFDACFEHLTQILDVCVRKCLVLSWEKSHFIVREGIVIGHLVSSKGLEVDNAKVEVIKDLALPKSIRELRSFIGHVGFYRHFIKDFAKVSKPQTSLVCKENNFIIEEEGKHAFMQLKQALVEAPILQSPNGTYLLRLCVMLLILQWARFWGNESTKSRPPYVT